MSPVEREEIVPKWIKANSNWLLSVIGAAFTIGTVYYQIRSDLVALRRDLDVNSQADASARSINPDGFASPTIRAGIDAALRKWSDGNIETKQHAANRWERLFELNPSIKKPGGE